MVLQQLQRPADAQRAFEIALQSGLAPNVAARAYLIGTILWQDQHRGDALQRFLKAVGALTRNWTGESPAAALLKTGREEESLRNSGPMYSPSLPACGRTARYERMIRLGSLRSVKRTRKPPPPR